MKKIILLSLISIGYIHAELSLDEKRKILEDKLLQRTSQQTKQKKSFYLPLKVNNILQDEIFVKIDNNENISVRAETFSYVVSLLKEKYKEQFNQEINSDGFAPLKNLEQLGIKAFYDNKKVMLNITLPPHIKKTSILNMNRRYSRDTNGSTVPKNYSGGVDLYLNKSYTMGSSNSNNLNLSSDLHINMNDFVIEGRVQYFEEEKKVRRGRFRLLKDDAPNQIRYKAGDIMLPAHNRMTYANVLGIAMEKLFNIGSLYTQNLTRINSHEFFIQNRSRIEIYVNTRYRNSLNLEAGTYNLFDLNLPTGINNVQLKIIEDSGKIEFVNFNDFSYSELLRKGLARYGVGVGIESEERSYELKYNQKKKVASGYMEYGLLDTLTVEGGLQLGDKYIASSSELLFGTDYGLINPYIVVTNNDGKTGYKKGVEYRTNLGSVNLNLMYEDVDSKYSALNSYNSYSLENTMYRANLYSSIGWGVSIGLTASSYERSNSNKEKRYEAIFRKNFGNLQTELNFEEIDTDGRAKDDRVYVMLDYRFGKNYAVRSTNYLTEERNRVNLQRMHTGRYGVTTDFQAEKTKEYTNYSLRSNLDNEKFRLDTTYTKSNYNNQGSADDTLGVQLATGFVFAGDTGTITAPITSSFVIVDNNDKLKTALGVTGYHENSDYIYDSYAIDIGDYSERKLTIDDSTLDFGVDIRGAEQKFISQYKSGSVFDIEVENFYSLKGKFINKDTQEPLQFKAFKIFNASTGLKTTSFTNENGEFTINEVEIGHYNISFMREQNQQKNARYSFDIKKLSQENLINLGVIQIDIPKIKKPKKYFIERNNSTK